MHFLLGALVGALVSWLVWEHWAFGWTLKHRLRADLFTLPRDEVFEELSFVTRERERSAGATVAQPVGESPALTQVLDALRLGRLACEWSGKTAEAEKIAAAFDAARSLASGVESVDGGKTK